VINDTIFQKLSEQKDQLKLELLKPLSLQYRELLAMYRAGRVRFSNDDPEATIAELTELSTEQPDDWIFADFVHKTVIDEQRAIASLKAGLQKVFAGIKGEGSFQPSNAMMIEYDWYYHYNSYATLMKSGFAYPVILEPRYAEEFDSSLFIKNYPGPDFSTAWPDCSEVEDEAELLALGDRLMNYFQYNSRVFLHLALKEMDKSGELAFLNQPFIFYVNEHDCEVMSLFVKE
jgi:hypothetical protein